MAADSDPKAALRLAEESLSKGVTFSLLELLDRLRVKDSEAATRFAGEVVAKLRGESLNTNTEATHVAVALLRTALTPQTSEQNFNGTSHAQGRAAEKPKPLALEDGDVRDLIDVVTGSAFKNSTQGGDFGLLTNLCPLLPEIEKLALIEKKDIERAIEKGDTIGAKAAAAGIKSKERRAAALAELAVAFALKEDRKSPTHAPSRRSQNSHALTSTAQRPPPTVSTATKHASPHASSSHAPYSPTASTRPPQPTAATTSASVPAPARSSSRSNAGRAAIVSGVKNSGFSSRLRTTPDAPSASKTLAARYTCARALTLGIYSRICYACFCGGGRGPLKE